MGDCLPRPVWVSGAREEWKEQQQETATEHRMIWPVTEYWQDGWISNWIDRMSRLQGTIASSEKKDMVTDYDQQKT